ncbi:hypothetical protein [Terrimonas alba]|uniref:hypothetical protein n=1 Tax=Terrimonas alba TaxID=3349636 RepID=UPI0035F4E5F5
MDIEQQAVHEYLTQGFNRPSTGNIYGKQNKSIGYFWKYETIIFKSKSYKSNRRPDIRNIYHNYDASATQSEAI